MSKSLNLHSNELLLLFIYLISRFLHKYIRLLVINLNLDINLNLASTEEESGMWVRSELMSKTGEYESITAVNPDVLAKCPRRK